MPVNKAIGSLSGLKSLALQYVSLPPHPSTRKDDRMNCIGRSLTGATLAAAVFSLAATVNPVCAADSKIQLMFVQSSEGLKADDKTLRLVNVSPQTIYFTATGRYAWPDISPCRTT